MTAEIETWRFHQKYETTDCPRSRPCFFLSIAIRSSVHTNGYVMAEPELFLAFSRMHE